MGDRDRHALLARELQQATELLGDRLRAQVVVEEDVALGGGQTLADRSS
jgi:hypothetical protein